MRPRSWFYLMVTRYLLGPISTLSLAFMTDVAIKTELFLETLNIVTTDHASCLERSRIKSRGVFSSFYQQILRLDHCDRG